MKKFKLVHILTMLSLVVVLASCGLTQPGYGDEGYSDRPVRSRSVYTDPYYGNTTIVRDPYTGRYYEVTPVSPYGYDTYSSPYGSYGNGRYYGRNSSRGYSNNSPRRSQSSQVQQQQPRESSPTIDKAKGIIRRD
jgi:hypothetical protein